jgi:hypothetical protein
MRLEYHVTFSVLISGILYMIFKSWSLSLSCLFSGIFIDLDHIIDYIREYGMSLRIKNFFHVCNTSKFNKLILILHGWEWLIICSIIILLKGWNSWIIGLFIGLSQHIILDFLSNGKRFRSYSLMWRWRIGFDYDIAFGKRLQNK